MKLVFVKDLLANSIVAKNVLNSEGKILISEGIKLTRTLINLLKRNHVLFIYIEDKLLGDVKTDEVLDELKEKSIQEMPKIFNEIVSGNYIDSKAALVNVENLVDHIISEGVVNTNLFEVRTFDDYTYIHSVDTCIMATFLGLALGYNEERLKSLSIAAVLHDIGKTKIKLEIINKKSQLTKYEFEEIKNHTLYGRDILNNMGIFNDEIINGVAQHHERIDGKGYPFKLKGDQICEFGRIISVCDVFTAVSANRSYRPRFDPKEAYELVISGAGTMFDSNIVQEFRNTFFVYPLGFYVKLSNGLSGYVVKQNKFFPDRPVVRIVKGNSNKYYEVNLVDNPNIVILDII